MQYILLLQNLTEMSTSIVGALYCVILDRNISSRSIVYHKQHWYKISNNNWMTVYRMNNRLFFLYATSNAPHYGMSETPGFYGDKTASTHAWHQSNINNNTEWYERKGIISNYYEELQ